MTKVEVHKNDYDWNITVKGHADYGPHGADIVCASISMLCCLMERILHDDKAVKIRTCRMNDGDVELDFNTFNTMVLHLTFREIIKGFEMIAQSYPDNCSYSFYSD